MAVIVARTAAPGADEGTHAHPAPR
jgi:hypothetical protein